MSELNSESEGIFEVEWIEKKLIEEDGKISYLIRWKGFTEDDNTWEPEGNLECKMLLEEFETRCQLDPSLVTDLRRPKKSKDSSRKRSRDTKEASHKKSRRSPSTLMSFTEMNFPDSWKKKSSDNSKKNSTNSSKNSSDSRKNSSDSWTSASNSWTSASNSWAYRLDYEKTGFDEGLTPERIIGANNASGQLVYLIKWKGRVDASLVRASLVKSKCPKLVLDFLNNKVAAIGDDN